MTNLKILPNNIANSIPFKALSQQERNEIDARIYRESNKEQWDINSKSAIIGLGAGAIAKFAKASRPLDKGIYAYFASYFLLSVINGLKNAKEYKEKYAQYEKEYNYKNGFDKLIGKIATPKPLDLGSEEKNKEYYKTYKDKYMFGVKLIVNSAIATGIATAGANAICNIKKIADKSRVIGNAAIISLLASIGLNFAIHKINENKNQSEQK